VYGVKGTIKSTDEITTLFKTAQRITTSNLIVLSSETDAKRDLPGRVAFIAGKRLGSAPRRNRAKRLMREAASFAQVPWSGFDVAFIAREQTASATLTALIEDIEGARQRLSKQAIRKKATS
jgi:ribonuclease P protein component